MLTSKGFRKGPTGSRVRAHNAKDVVIRVEERQEESRCEAALTIVAMDDELGNPANLTISVLPAARKDVTC